MMGWKKILFLGFLILGTFSSNGQKETYNWTFGNGVGMDFSSGSPVLFSHSMTTVSVYESSASISDASGNILFYTNGYSVWDKNGNVMTGGNQTLKVGLGGTNGSSAQGALIVKHADNANQYYVFTTDAANDAGDYGYNYAVVDMSLQGGLGEVTSINRLKDAGGSNFNTNEFNTAVMHSNGTDIWVVTHKWQTGGSNEFLAYLVTSSGVSAVPVASSIGYNYPIKDEGRGSLAFSSTGKAVAVHHHQGWPYNNAIELFDFNNSTGQFSNLITLGNTNWNNYASGYDAVFSPDGSKLYTTFITYNGIVQYDLSTYNQSAIKSSETLIVGSNLGSYGQMKIGPDGVLYKARESMSYIASVTGDLNGSASGLTYNNTAINLSGYGSSSLSMPNMVASLVTPLVVDFIEFKGEVVQDEIYFTGELGAIENIASLELEHSSDGTNYEVVAFSIDVNSSLLFFNVPYSSDQNSYYRLKATEKNGEISYSKTLNFKTSLKSPKLQLSSKTGMLHLDFVLDEEEVVEFKVLDLGHRVIETKHILAEGKGTKRLAINSKGFLIVQVTLVNSGFSKAFKIYNR